jgi:hypothetical protein
MITFLNVNGSLLTISLIKYSIYNYFNNTTFFNKFMSMYLTYIIRNYSMMYLLFNATKNKPFINKDNINNNSNYQIKSHIYLLSTTFLDTITSMFLYNIIINDDTFLFINVINSIIYFIITGKTF